jgi:hypothetical protein
MTNVVSLDRPRAVRWVLCMQEKATHNVHVNPSSHSDDSSHPDDGSHSDDD